MKELVYIAGPINSDSCGTYKNVHKLVLNAEDVKKMGVAIYNPANDLVQGIVSGNWDYNDYTSNDFPILKNCSCMYLTKGWKDSPGCKKEKAFCEQHNIPVFTEYWDLYDFIHRPTILCIIGESGSGKTYMADYIKEKYGIPMIESYTTREPRYDGERGHTFISKKEFLDINKKDMIAFTRFGGNLYCCKHSDVQKKNTYILDERGMSMLRCNHHNKYKIITVRVHSSEEDRLSRDIPIERIMRDDGMFLFDYKEFDYFINNSFGFGVFENQIDTIVEEVF